MHSRAMRFLKRITFLHHLFHMLYVTFGVVFGVFTHGTGFYFMRFSMVLAGFVMAHYIVCI
jgi:hypothetical protein